MSAESLHSDSRRAPAGTVILWCIAAAAVVCTLLLVEPDNRYGVAFWNASGAFTVLADLLFLFILVIIPATLGGRETPVRAYVEGALVLLLSAFAGLAMLSLMANQPAWAVVRLAGFALLTAAAAAAWVRGAGRTAYLAVACVSALGVPVALFFVDELFAIEAPWLAVLSPMTAWRTVLEGDEGAMIAWFLVGLLAVAGGVLCVRRAWRTGS